VSLLEQEEWINLSPAEVITAVGSVYWTGKCRVISIPTKIIEKFPDLKRRSENIYYKMEVFQSRKAYEKRIIEIIEKKEPLPIHLFLQKEK